jgi:monofunctional glycosyltransferase
MHRDDDALDDDEPEPAPRRRFRLRHAVFALLIAPFILPVLYLVIPPVSTLMLAHWLTLKPATRSWVPLEQISPHAVRAVMASEDARFCAHNGVDWREMQQVWGQGGLPSRGASTLTMQTAKNLFLWQNPASLRKPVEIVLAHWLEWVMPKRRILEIYLNTAEWGPGSVFGIEEGARRAFRKAAADLTPRQAALMATALPNPHLRNPARPGASMSRHAVTVMARMGSVDTGCVLR